MRKIVTIQKRNKLNDIYVGDDVGAGGAHHNYLIVKADTVKVEGDAIVLQPENIVDEISFQHGARKDEGSITGVLDSDLLEIVRDRLFDFQKGEFATRENAIALTHIEEALLWLNKRTEDRAERGVLGTMKK